MDFDDNNPFAEQRTSGSPYSNGASNYGYNPFGNDSSANPSSPPPPPPVSPSAVYIPAPSPPPVYQAPVYTPSSPPAATRQPSYPSDPKETSTRVDLTAFERQQAELAEREKRMNERQGAINPSTPITPRVKNFPPLPKFCPCGPCFYHDISVDIPGPLQIWARYLYILWITYAVTLLLNMIGGLSYFIVDSKGGATFGLSLVYLFLFVPLSYVCWYRPIYRALRTDSSVYYMLFFFISVFFIGVNILFATGLIEGMCGLIIMIQVFANGDDGVIVGLVAMMITISFSLIAVAGAILLIRVHRLYRASGASIAQAQQEIQTAIVNNQTVRGAAREVAREAVTTGINDALRTDGK